MKFYVRMEPKVRKIVFKDIVFINTMSKSNDEYIDLSNEDNFLIREETEEIYGLCIKENTLYLTANGEMIPFVVPKKYQNYGHDFDKTLRRLPRSGIEVETDNSFTTAIIFSLIRYIRPRYSDQNIKYDGSLNDGGREFLLNLSTWIKILPYVKPTLRFQSTHIHFSTRPLLAYFTALNASQDEPFAALFGNDLYDDWGNERDEDEIIECFNETTFADACNVVFGRFFNKYATPFIREYKYDRYAFITVPTRPCDDERITVEIRITKLTNMETMIYFLRFLERIYNVIQQETTISIDTFINAVFQAYSTDVPTDKKQQQQTMLQLWRKLVRIDRKLNKTRKEFR